MNKPKTKNKIKAHKATVPQIKQAYQEHQDLMALRRAEEEQRCFNHFLETGEVIEPDWIAHAYETVEDRAREKRENPAEYKKREIMRGGIFFHG
jgi:hypothetical protein